MDALTRPGRIVATLAVAVFVAACSSQAGGSTPPPSTAPQPSSAAASGGAFTVDVHQDAAMGAWLTGQDGKSLYLLTKDSAGTSTCTGSCATAWPPFILGQGQTVSAGAGVSGTLSTIKRPDGTDQVAINGLPLYYFAGDSGPAQDAGQGVNGVWFLASPSGMTLGAGASPAGSPADSTPPKYNY